VCSVCQAVHAVARVQHTAKEAEPDCSSRDYEAYG
jgi:hypothetical protein